MNGSLPRHSRSDEASRHLAVRIWLLGMVLGGHAAGLPSLRGESMAPAAGGATMPSHRGLDEITVTLDLNPGPLPADHAQALFTSPAPCDRGAMGRSDWSDLALLWAPTEFAHPPLYFDQTPLERYGVTPCRPLQPALSGVHFFGTAALLPAKMLADFPFRPVSQLGPHRAGTCTCPLRQQLRLQIDPIWLHPLTGG